MAKFGFVHWEWEEQINIDSVNMILESIQEPIWMINVETDDDIVIAIYTRDIDLSEEEWTSTYGYAIYGPRNDDEDFPDKSKNTNYYEVDLAELRSYLKKKDIEDQEEAKVYQEEEKKKRIQELKNELNKLGENV